MIELTNIVSAATNLNATLNSALNASSYANESATDNYDAALPDMLSTTTATTTIAEATITTLITPALNDFMVNASTAAVELTTQWLAAAIAQTTTATTTTTTIPIATTTNYSGWSSSSSSSNDSFAAAAGAAIAGPELDLWLGPSLNSNLTHFNITDDDFAACHPYNPNFNCTRSDYLQYSLGPQTLPLYKVLLVTIIFGGIFITGVLGNVLVCVVIVRHSNMHTATNYYLFSLAVSDLLYLLFGLPQEVFIYYHQYPYLFGLPFCKIRAFISEASTYVSVLTIVAFSMERFLAICHPLHLCRMSGFKRAVRIISALWIVSFISALPFGLMTGLQYLKYPLDQSEMLESAFCSFPIPFPDNCPLFELSFCVFFVIPMILIIVLYGKMGAQIRSTTAQQLGVQRGSMHKESRNQQRKAVIRMLAAVVLTFFVCWLPFHIQRLWYLYAQEYENFQEVNDWLFSVTGFAYYVSCTINPILYNVMSLRYRVAFKDILCGKRKSVYYNNGFARDQSSFRDTTIASSLGGNSTYDRVHSVRVRSIRHMNNVKDRDSIKSNQALWLQTKKEFNTPKQKDIFEDTPTLGTNVVVVMDNGANGRPKVYTENEAQETLINKNNETCI